MSPCTLFEQNYVVCDSYISDDTLYAAFWQSLMDVMGTLVSMASAMATQTRHMSVNATQVGMEQTVRKVQKYSFLKSFVRIM